MLKLKKIVCCVLVTLALLLAVVSTTPLVAQDWDKNRTVIPAGAENKTGGDYCFVGYESDTVNALWHVVGSQWRVALADPENWQLRELLDGKPREFLKNGVVMYNVVLGECFFVPAPIKAFVPLVVRGPKPATSTGTGGNPPDPGFKFSSLYWGVPNWVWITLLTLVVVVALVMAIHDWLRNDPTRVGAGRVREEGIHTPNQALEHFDIELSREFGERLPIINLVRGRGYGFTRITDIARKYFPRFLNGEQVWEVTARRPNGEQVVRYSLMGCANDVRNGGGMVPGIGFRFVPEENVTNQIIQPPAPATQVTEPVGPAATSTHESVPTTVVTPPPASPIAEPEPESIAQPALEPAPIHSPVTPVVEKSGSWITIEIRGEENDKPGMFRIKSSETTIHGVDYSHKDGITDISMRFTNNKK